MTYLSPFTPLFFADIASDGIPCRCMQVFAPGDVILIELFSDDDVEAWLVKESDESKVSLTFASEDLDDGGALFYAQVSGLADDVYWLHVEGLGDSEPFEVTSNQSVLDATALFQYGTPPTAPPTMTCSLSIARSAALIIRQLAPARLRTL